ncbi:MAG: DNA-binding domain-containing protein [Betaproteobacteria bacterium]|nr:DNA-binding domain-containing protein [Betaproteobacteria bacterium]MDH5210745.1 DNA-binding domain-containing protein [Betaproteobacteria bacterium]
MLSLLEQQRAFAAALLDAAAGPARMRVYRANVFGNWSAALAGAYPIVRAIVGAACFEVMARDYSQVSPSASGDLHEYGAQLAAFLDGYPQAADLPYLPDVARMEWLAHLAFYAADPPPFDLSRPTEVRLAPPCALLGSAWPLQRIWEAHQEGGDPASVNLDAGPDRILVHRAGWRVEVCSLGAGDYRFLERLRAGDALGPALEAATAADAAFVARVAFAAWVQAGVIAQ